MNIPPKIENAPGLTWRKRKSGWEARWQCRTDLSRRGYEVKSQRLWVGEEPTETEIAYIQSRCDTLQTNMLVWGRGGVPQVMSFDGTLRGLMYAYQRDKDSNYRKLRYSTRVFYDTLCRRIDADMGMKLVTDITARDLLAWHREFSEAGHIPMGHACVGMLRTVLSFGSTILADKSCRELRVMLHDMRFPMGKARTSALSAEQAIMIRAGAHKIGLPSIALAQAFQFELTLRQKDVIGEWVPNSEPGISVVLWGNSKWMRGIRWEEIGPDLRISHVTSKRQKEITVNLRNAPMVMEELDIAYPGWGGDRSKLPASGPVIVAEAMQVPWLANEFRRKWRQIATACGIPKGVFNMDTRAGAITEALASGQSLETVRKAATHSDVNMTQRYSRDDERAIEQSMKSRAASRNKSGT